MNITGEAINSLSKRSRIPRVPAIFSRNLLLLPYVWVRTRINLPKWKIWRLRFPYLSIGLSKAYPVWCSLLKKRVWYRMPNLRKILPMTSLAICARTVDVYLTYNLRYTRRYRLSIRIQKEPSANIRYSWIVDSRFCIPKLLIGPEAVQHKFDLKCYMPNWLWAIFRVSNRVAWRDVRWGK